MTKIAYVEQRFNKSSIDIIARADVIMREYAEQGFALTLRQLYYQFVARGYLPNKQTEYKRLGSIVNDARMAGLLDWDSIEDRTRNLRSLPKWESPEHIMESIAEQYRIDLWDGQPVRPEVWIEKDALTGVIEPVCHEFRVDYFACRGYTSQSEQWRSAIRIINRWTEHKQRTVIFHLGDHDPSGIDMTRDNLERLRLFVKHHLGSRKGDAVEVIRLALNMDQVEEHNPPPNPAKLTDSRVGAYLERFGDESWELDALDPKTIDGLIRKNVLGSIGEAAIYARRKREEENQKRDLEIVRDHFDTAKSAAWDEHNADD